jgi:hypothetical protein
VVTVAGESGGSEAVFDFSALPGPPALLAACAAGFARMAGPDHPWRAAATCDHGYKAIREFLRWAAALDPPPQHRGSRRVWAPTRAAPGAQHHGELPQEHQTAHHARHRPDPAGVADHDEDRRAVPPA